MKTTEIKKKTATVKKIISAPIDGISNLSKGGKIFLLAAIIGLCAIFQLPILVTVFFSLIMIFLTQKLSWKLDSIPIVQMASAYAVIIIAYQWISFNNIKESSKTFEITDTVKILEAKFLPLAGSFSYTLNGTLFTSMNTKFLIADQERFLINCHLETRTIKLSKFNSTSDKFAVCDNANATLLNQEEVDAKIAEEAKIEEEKKKETEKALEKNKRLDKYL